MIISGNIIFNLMDSEGVPLESMLAYLEERDIVVEWKSFIESSLRSPNFSESKLIKLMTHNMPNPHKKIEKLGLTRIQAFEVFVYMCSGNL